MMLMRKAQGWFTGYNSNVEGHEQGKIRYLVYNGGHAQVPGQDHRGRRAGLQGHRLPLTRQGTSHARASTAPSSTERWPSAGRSRSSVDRPWPASHCECALGTIRSASPCT